MFNPLSSPNRFAAHGPWAATIVRLPRMTYKVWQGAAQMQTQGQASGIIPAGTLAAQ
jgi:hypothetical protein